jgi:hypothetical protein
VSFIPSVLLVQRYLHKGSLIAPDARTAPHAHPTALAAHNTRTHGVSAGVTVGSVLVDCDGFSKGLAVVAQNILEVSDIDVVILAVRYPNKRGRAPNSLVCECD